MEEGSGIVKNILLEHGAFARTKMINALPVEFTLFSRDGEPLEQNKGRHGTYAEFLRKA